MGSVARDDEARHGLDQLIVPGSCWITLTTPAPIDRGSGETSFNLEIAVIAAAAADEAPRYDVAGGQVAVRTETIRAFHGLLLMIFGRVVRERGARENAFFFEYRSPDGGGFTLQVYRVVATWPGAPLRAAMYWQPDESGVSENTERVAPVGNGDDWKRAERALTTIRSFVYRLGGAPRIEADPKARELALARRAVKLRARGMEWRDIVVRLGMLPDDDMTDDPLQNRRAEASAVRKLQRYVERLKKIEQSR